MQTDTYANLFSLIQGFCGATLSTAETTRVNAFINARARSAYLKSDYWPRWLVVGEARPCNSSGLFPHEAGDMSSVDAFLRLHKTDPWNDSSAQEYEFYVTSNGAQAIGYSENYAAIDLGSGDGTFTPQNGYYFNWTNSNSDFLALGGFDGQGVLVDYTVKLAGVVLTAASDGVASGYNTTHVITQTGTTTIRNETSLSAIVPVIDTATSDFELSIEGAYVTYRKQLNVTYGDGTGSTTATIPGEWFDYLAHGSYSDWLRSEGQNEKAVIEDQLSESRLMLELEKIDRQHIGDSVAKRIRTNLNMTVRQ